MQLLKWVLFSWLLASGLAGTLFYTRLEHYADRRLPLAKPQIITLVPGSNQHSVVQLLQAQQLLNRPHYLEWLWRIHPSLAHFKAGTYRVLPGMTLRTLLQLFQRGEVAQFKLCFVEGSSYRQWLSQLNAAPYLRHNLLGRTPGEVANLLNLPYPVAEGWLFPDTYYYTAGMQDLQVLQRAHQEMQKHLAVAWQGRQADLPLKSPYQLLILASIIEKETALDHERPKIASVFINRLRRGMRLQADPTVVYGLGEGYVGPLTRRAISQPSDYNTYRNGGLPPTPITMPGKAALQAAAQPAHTNYLYFIADGKGGHTFSSDFLMHCQGTRSYRKQLRQANDS